ncbi:MAG: hypothetical protein LUC51_11495 [Cloacibacillus porcorum]|nr:hypothetical protein [Cloacibacillus porcorum]
MRSSSPLRFTLPLPYTMSARSHPCSRISAPVSFSVSLPKTIFVGA